MQTKVTPKKAYTHLHLTAAKIKKLPIEIQYRIKGAVDVLEIQKAQRVKKNAV